MPVLHDPLPDEEMILPGEEGRAREEVPTPAEQRRGGRLGARIGREEPDLRVQEDADPPAGRLVEAADATVAEDLPDDAAGLTAEEEAVRLRDRSRARRGDR